MSDQSQANMHAARAAQGGKGQGQKERRRGKHGEPMQTGESVAGVVRLQPGGSGADDAASKKGRAQQQHDAPQQEHQGAKGKTVPDLT